MTQPVEMPQTSISPEGRASLIAVWSELKAHLERRSKELNDEVRNYPTPIARCDEQLADLLERRSHMTERLRLVIESDPGQSGKPAPDWRAGLQRYLLASARSVDDEVELALRSRLEKALLQVSP